MKNTKQKIIETGLTMSKKNLTIETWGNLSCIDKDGNIYITPSGMPYDTLQENDICILDTSGKQIGGKRKPSIESMLHVLIYQNRKDVHAIIHTHAIASTIFATLHKPIPVITDEMAQSIGGTVECAKYALPGTLDLAKNVVAALDNKQAVLMSNHGAVCVGKDFTECLKVASVLESCADIYQKALTIGTPIKISTENTLWMRDFALHKYGQ